MLNKAGHMSKTMPNFCMEGLTFQFGQHLDIRIYIFFNLLHSQYPDFLILWVWFSFETKGGVAIHYWDLEALNQYPQYLQIWIEPVESSFLGGQRCHTLPPWLSGCHYFISFPFFPL